jgi:cob(I)alamin adenosyltransferase
MKIYTRKGDTGTTQLIGGTRVPKHALRIESYGSVDELNSYIGLIRDQAINENHKNQLIEIQDRLFTLGSHLASDPEKATMKLPEIKSEDVTALEQWIDDMDQVLPEMKSFVLPGGHTTVSFCHIARCVCRRAERITDHLNDEHPVDPFILTYLNRLSDYLFVLSRKLTQDLNAPEQPWIPRY